MPESEKTVSLLNRKIKEGKALVLSDSEFVHEIRAGHRFGVADVDVVTVAWNSAITGTAVMLCVPVTKRGVFTRAGKIWLNGVPGFPGPAPNERLGVVDTLIFAEQLSRDTQTHYNGAMLFVDLMRKGEVEVECLSEEGDTYRNTVTLDQLQFARMYIYNCFVCGLPGGVEKVTPHACHHLAPVVTGSKILLNRAPGIVIGSGTRSAPGRRSLSLSAEMFEMDPEVMSRTGGGAETGITNSIALAIPVLDEEGLRDLSSWLLAGRFAGQREDLQGRESDMSRSLKELVLKGSFLLTGFDMKSPAPAPAAPGGVVSGKGGRE